MNGGGERVQGCRVWQGSLRDPQARREWRAKGDKENPAAHSPLTQNKMDDLMYRAYIALHILFVVRTLKIRFQ